MQRELLDKYFSNECSDEERKQVLEYFRNHPEEWNQYVNEEDWDNFKTDDELNTGLTDKLFKDVSRQTFKKRTVTAYGIAAAALIALLIGSVWMYRITGNSDIAKDSVTTTPSGQFVEKTNLSDTLLHLLLEDGSTVILSPRSSVRYQEQFIAEDSRSVYLTGKALFQVGGYKGKPFIVHTDRLATTVLGTSFTVQSFEEETAIRVKLHKGKIQVATVSTVQEKWNGKELLQPGDELIYNKTTMLASIHRYTPAEQMVKAGPAGKKDLHVRRPDRYTFDMSPLAAVFEQLSVYYQIDIYYYPSEIQNKYFSGKMRKSDSLETILNDIAVLNQLKIEKKEGYYILSNKD